MPCLVSLTGTDCDFQSLSRATWATTNWESPRRDPYEADRHSEMIAITVPEIVRSRFRQSRSTDRCINDWST